MSNIEYAKIVNKYSNQIYKIIFCMVQNKDDTSEIIQKVFTKVYSSKKVFSNDETFFKWLIRLTINETKPYWDISLSPKLRLVFHLYYYEKISTKDIASILHTVETIVKARLQEATVLLKISSDDESLERGYVNE